MKYAIRIAESTKENSTKIELTDIKGNSGWKQVGKNNISSSEVILKRATKVVYLGCCITDGDMFAIYNQGYIRIYKGYLNSGKY